MAPVAPTLKTYSRKHIQNRRNSSVDVFDALLAENICKRKEAAHTGPRRRKKPILLKELPPPDENHHLIEDSICKAWGMDNTFDRLCKEPVYGNIKPAFMTASNRSASNSRILVTNSVHSPIIYNTRSYKKRLDSSSESSQNSINTNKKKERTLDKSINEILTIEKVPRFVKPKEISFLSSTSNVKSDESVPPQMRNDVNYKDADVSYEPLFSKTFRETVGAKMHIASTPAVASSTPCRSTPLVNETMSPILNNSQPKSLIESYEEIQKWNFKPPDFKVGELGCNDTPKVKRKRQLQPKKLQKKKDILKHKIVNENVISALIQQTKSPAHVYRAKPDWKLKGEAKVVLDKCLDVIGIEKSVTFGNLNEPTLGFTADPEDVLRNSLAMRSIFEDSFEKICAQQNMRQNIEVGDANCISGIPSPVRYIVLRKRRVLVHSKTKPKTEKTDLELGTHRKNKSSTNSRELDVNNKPIHSKAQNKRNGSQNSSSLSQQEFNLNPKPNCKENVENMQHNSSKTSSTKNSMLGESSESIQNLVSKIIVTDATDSQDSSINQESCDEVVADLSSLDIGSRKKRPRRVSEYETSSISLSSNNDENNKGSNVIENVTQKTNAEISAINDSNRPCSISLQSNIELVVNNNKIESIDKVSETVSDRMTSPDVIPSTPPAKNMFNRVNYKQKIAESLIEISTDCSKTVECSQSQIQNDLKEQSVTNFSNPNIQHNTANDFTKDSNYHDSEMEDKVDISNGKTNYRVRYQDDHSYYTLPESILSIDSENEVCDEVEPKCKVECEAKFKESLQKYFKPETSYLDNDKSILEHHNYSKVCRYLDNMEVIEVSSSDEEDENENMQNINNSTSPKSNNSWISTSKCNNKDHDLECENSNSSSEITQKVDLPSKMDASPSSTKSKCSNKNNISGYHNSKMDDQHTTAKYSDECASANNSDEELDFSEFIASNEESNFEIQQEEDDTVGLLTQSTVLPVNTTAEESKATFKTPTSLVLKPGKLWRRSLLTMQRNSIICAPIVCKANLGCICTCAKCRQKNASMPTRSNRRLSIKIVPESPNRLIQHDASILENYASLNITYGSNTIQDSVYREKSIGEPLLVRKNSIHESLPIINPTVTARDIVLRRCGQAEPISFMECYPSSALKNCFKIGEGVYGEVFLFKNPNGGSCVMKIIPIEGAQMVNGEHQKKFEEILSEIIIAMELSNLRTDKKNKTEGFSKVEKIRCVQGRYPERLVELWELFDENRNSENDSPEMFTDDQLYIVLELANGGEDLEAFAFNNALQAFTLFQQIACALAVAESALQFEHRDLHWGNVLISRTDKNKQLTYCLNGDEFTIPTCGIEVSIIDFTLSRITCDGVCIFNDLSTDPDLFEAKGDYQFKIYKLMQKRNLNEWQHFEPYSNVLWLHYVLDKMASALRYKNTNTNVHKEGIAKIKELGSRILDYSSVEDMVKNEYLS